MLQRGISDQSQISKMEERAERFSTATDIVSLTFLSQEMIQADNLKSLAFGRTLRTI